MDFTQFSIDILRAAHLVCFAAGMGTALYFDFHSFRTIRDPLHPSDVKNLERIHIWISAAFACMWVTGMTLIYIRTAFDISMFSPKLWLKIILMTLLIWNARKVGTAIIPMLQRNAGRSLAQLSVRELMAATQLAANSMFFWTSGLLLRSSVVLKTASWTLLLPLAVGWFVTLTCVGQAAVWVMRTREQTSVTGTVSS